MVLCIRFSRDASVAKLFRFRRPLDSEVRFTKTINSSGIRLQSGIVAGSGFPPTAEGAHGVTFLPASLLNSRTGARLCRSNAAFPVSFRQPGALHRPAVWAMEVPHWRQPAMGQPEL